MPKKFFNRKKPVAQKKTGRNARRKKRVRKHIIADLSANYVERWLLLSGFTTEKFTHDYGYDMTVSTYDSHGEFENGCILIQLKATDHIRFVDQKTNVAFRISKQDVLTWFNETNPVMVIIFDAKQERAYWVYLQQYLRNLPNFDIETVAMTLTIRIPVGQQLDSSSFELFRQYKINNLNQSRNVITYE